MDEQPAHPFKTSFCVSGSFFSLSCEICITPVVVVDDSFNKSSLNDTGEHYGLFQKNVVTMNGKM